MTEEELLVHVYGSDIFKKWHWFRYHFELTLRGHRHSFSEGILQACLDCERRIPGFAVGMMEAVASLSGREKDLQHYEQLMARLAELLVIRQAVNYPWPFDARYRWEPTAAGSKKNPELVVEGGPWTFGVEVKVPSLLDHIAKRGKNSTQFPARAMPQPLVKKWSEEEGGATLPRDNPVKDFLISSESKFVPFKAADPEFRGVLVIVWDDFIYEPISSLIHPQSGLFTPSSFAKGEDGSPLIFPSVDGVIVVRHLHQLGRSAGDKPLIDQCRGPLEYGRDGDFPPKAYIHNPHGKGLPGYVVECFQGYTPTPDMGAEYVPSDFIFWVDMPAKGNAS